MHYATGVEASPLLNDAQAEMTLPGVQASEAFAGANDNAAILDIVRGIFVAANEQASQGMLPKSRRDSYARSMSISHEDQSVSTREMLTAYDGIRPLPHHAIGEITASYATPAIALTEEVEVVNTHGEVIAKDRGMTASLEIEVHSALARGVDNYMVPKNMVQPDVIKIDYVPMADPEEVFEGEKYVTPRLLQYGKIVSVVGGSTVRGGMVLRRNEAGDYDISAHGLLPSLGDQSGSQEISENPFLSHAAAAILLTQLLQASQA